jgi:hypothetical protein
MSWTIRHVRGAGRRKPNNSTNGYARARQKTKFDQQRTNLLLLRRRDRHAGGLRGCASTDGNRRGHSRAAGLLRCLTLPVRGLRHRLRRSGVLRFRGRPWIIRELNRGLHSARRCRCALGRSSLLWRLLLGDQRLCCRTYQNQKTSCHSRHSLIHSCSSKAAKLSGDRYLHRSVCQYLFYDRLGRQRKCGSVGSKPGELLKQAVHACEL